PQAEWSTRAAPWSSSTTNLSPLVTSASPAAMTTPRRLTPRRRTREHRSLTRHHRIRSRGTVFPRGLRVVPHLRAHERAELRPRDVPRPGVLRRLRGRPADRYRDVDRIRGRDPRRDPRRGDPRRPDRTAPRAQTLRPAHRPTPHDRG